MPNEISLEDTIHELKAEFTAMARHEFLDEVQELIEGEADLQPITAKTRPTPRFVSVSFDRRRNDQTFSYAYFDFILLLLDRWSGGSGIRNPVNQLRVIQWRGSRTDLIQILRFLARHIPQIDYRRLLVAPYRSPAAGHRIDPSFYRK
jgi:hypothetical protein